jgi:hypothetical protein
MRVLNTSTILVGQFRGSAYGVCSKDGSTDGGWRYGASIRIDTSRTRHSKSVISRRKSASRQEIKYGVDKQLAIAAGPLSPL